LKIGIIGGGISALSAAYTLAKDHEVIIFEKKDYLGGNADTKKVVLGKDKDGKELVRWVDLGVNDFNAVTYTKILEVMNEIGYIGGVNYKPLEDTTSFFTLDGSIAYTASDDGAWNTEMPKELADNFKIFMKTAPQDSLQQKHPYRTVKEYLETKKDNDGKLLYLSKLGTHVIYPRINAMYFVDETGPEKMPLRSVMHYYIIQEGAGCKKKPERMYFVNGADSWINALAKYIGVNIKRNWNAAISASKDDGVTVHKIEDDGSIKSENDQKFDKVIFACPADDALRCYRAGITEEISEILSSFRYLVSISIAHTFSGVMPPDKNAWRTYNILIHQPPNRAIKPYTISYVCNRHQNDAQNPEYNKFGLPEFFITCNPIVPIPEQYILREKIDSGEGKPAITYLKHFILKVDALKAQDRIKNIQGINNVYFTGGWTNGTGLQEECWVSGQCVAGLINDPNYVCEHDYNFDPNVERYFPKFMDELVS